MRLGRQENEVGQAGDARGLAAQRCYSPTCALLARPTQTHGLQFESPDAPSFKHPPSLNSLPVRCLATCREGYRDAYLTAHFEVPGEMFSLAMDAKRQRGMGVVGSTQNILDFIAAK